MILLPIDQETRQPEFLAWLRQQGIEPNFCYKLEIDEENNYLEAYTYAKNEMGQKYVDMSTGEPVKEPTICKPMTRKCPL